LRAPTPYFSMNTKGEPERNDSSAENMNDVVKA